MIYFIIIMLILSISLNGFLIWYVRNLLADLSYISSNFFTLKHNVDVFIGHLKRFRANETYSEEPIVKALSAHSEDLMEYLTEFNENLVLAEEEEFYDEEAPAEE